MGSAPFEKILVANRGEIAVRVIRTCRDMGIKSVAVYSEADQSALHTRLADEAYLIGPAAARESYLNPGRIIETALQSGAKAIHPGYGFLSEQAAFAQACTEAGISFIGPSARALDALGDKVSARRIAEAAGVPTVPGTASRTSLDAAPAEAERIGFPLLIKAASGGGGKGIRLVSEPNDLEAALRGATAEAGASFGDEGVYLERYIDPVRHLEVQVLGDREGHVVHLGERECSVQRRSQKLLEEAPSPVVDAALRQRLGESALAIARESGYESAGTVEFLLDESGDFYFIEANARLQVEHPVTEFLTGVDIVREQINIAAGTPLSFTQADVRLEGASIECRVLAEDGQRNFLPSTGTVEFVSEPSGPGVRMDSSLYTGLDVAGFYDSLLAKAVVWGKDREEARHRMLRALDEYRVLGIETTIPFHRSLLQHPDFIAANLDTLFIERKLEGGGDEARPEDKEAALITAALLAHQRLGPGAAGGESGSKQRPWRQAARSEATHRGGGGKPWRSTS